MFRIEAEFSCDADSMMAVRPALALPVLVLPLSVLDLTLPLLDLALPVLDLALPVLDLALPVLVLSLSSTLHCIPRAPTATPIH